jgi:hypothetical protein
MPLPGNRRLPRRPRTRPRNARKTGGVKPDAGQRPAETFTTADIGERDGWICGICQDTSRLVNPQPGSPRALTPSIDHIIPVASGGTHTRDNVQITHLWCNVEKNSGGPPPPEYTRAQLSQLLNGTPVPEEIHRSQYPSWQWPARPRIDYIIALEIATGQVAADPATETPPRDCQTPPPAGFVVGLIRSATLSS